MELTSRPDPCENQAKVGVDLGIHHLATLSDGMKIPGPKPLKRRLKQLRRKQRQLSRKVKGSSNRAKARMAFSKLHYRVRCIRQDGLHKLTTHLVKHYGTIAIEDLNVKGMLGNRRLSRAIMDMGFYEFRRQLAYKAQIYGNHLEVVDRWYPSSKRCSGCQEEKAHLALSERHYDCEHCGLSIDRDLNAAKNLLHTVSSTEFQACGEKGSGIFL